MRRFDVLILGFVIAVLVAALGVISWQSIRGAESLLLPALDEKADVDGRTLAGQVAQALSYEIALDDLRGVEPVFETMLARNDEFGFVALVGPDGRATALSVAPSLAGAGDTVAALSREMRTVETPVVVDGQTEASVVIGIPNVVAQTLIQSIWLDMAVLLLVSFLVALQLLSFAFTLPSASVLSGLARRIASIRSGDFRPHPPVAGSGPLAVEVANIDQETERLRATQARLATEAEREGATAVAGELDEIGRRYRLGAERTDPPGTLLAVKAPVFLFFLAEELTRPFLPTYIESFAEPIAGLSIEMVISLPIVIFMAIVAIAQPTLNNVTERIGRSRSMGVGALLALIGFVGTAYVGNMIELIIWRSVTALALAIVFVAAQGFIVDRTGAANRGRGLGLFVSAIMVAMVCGPPIGGVVADRIGTTAAFLVAAAMCLASAICAIAALPEDPPGLKGRGNPMRLRQALVVLKKPALVALLVGCALPAKMILIGFCFYYLPLVLSAEGFDSATIGHVLMLYGLAMVVLIPLVSRLSDRGGGRVPFVVAGAIVSALAVGQIYLWPAPWGAAIAVLQIGVAQGLSITPQSALVGELGARYAPDLSQGGLYGIFRLIERTGNALGPAVFAFIWGLYGVDMAIWVTSAIVAVGGVALAVTVMVGGGSAPAMTPAKSPN
ncbi:MFS transporter [Amorphus orientalis]|uniref:MFS family arabinose efflux permease n=1 Tax=Amorphus orientalis TaxID=649198 RepID=A0AAE3VRQ3_9HYPH|nr:MFS transporter [Amorphus orientalis]MDQ0317544.1 putative MFS family arabinose efflux permease [Amorphus orientalis]